MWAEVPQASSEKAVAQFDYNIHANSRPVVQYRSLWPQDFAALKDAHHELFPIDYDDAFFHNAVMGQDGIFSFAATVQEGDTRQLAGFITAKALTLRECDEQSRQVMGLGSRMLEQEPAVYILTLGVLPAWRQRGIASQLLALVRQHSCVIHSKLLYLHVIAYNSAAIALYSRAAFRCVSLLPSFYHISSGRQPHPSQYSYDAYLYALQLAPWAPCPTYLGQLAEALNPLCCGMLPVAQTVVESVMTRASPSAPPAVHPNDAYPSYPVAPLPQDSPSRSAAIPMWHQDPCGPPDPSPSSADSVLRWLFNPDTRWR